MSWLAPARHNHSIGSGGLEWGWSVGGMVGGLGQARLGKRYSKEV